MGWLSYGGLRICDVPQQLLPCYLNMMEQIHRFQRTQCNPALQSEMHDLQMILIHLELPLFPVFNQGIKLQKDTDMTGFSQVGS